MMKSTALVTLALALVAFWIVDSRITAVRAQGSLTPPGAPAPTMKTLDQLEPRTPIDAARTPGNFLAHYIITQPGSYYLTGNVAGVSGKRGIQIQTGNVTIDLNGFALLGVPESLQGIYYPSGVTNVTIRNGIIAGWLMGITQPGFNSVFERLIVATNLGDGIVLGQNCVLRDCTIWGNGQNGVLANGSGSLIINNLFSGNNAANNTAAAGILILGARNRVEGNHVTGSGPAGTGISISNGSSHTNNVVIRNTVAGGTNNFSYNSSQVVGPLITSAAEGIITNSNPWANFSLP